MLSVDMKRLPIIVFILVSLAVGCGPRFGGAVSSSYANADQETTTEVVAQRDLDGQFLFVIAWTAKHGGGNRHFSGRNLLTSIHGHPVHPSLEQHSVYTLQPDGTLRQIPISVQQVSTLFREIQASDFHPSHSDLWQKEIAPHLARVEATNGS